MEVIDNEFLDSSTWYWRCPSAYFQFIVMSGQWMRTHNYKRRHRSFNISGELPGSVDMDWWAKLKCLHPIAASVSIWRSPDFLAETTWSRKGSTSRVLQILWTEMCKSSIFIRSWSATRSTSIITLVCRRKSQVQSRNLCELGIYARWHERIRS
jgi:hypothetical protein